MDPNRIHELIKEMRDVDDQLKAIAKEVGLSHPAARMLQQRLMALHQEHDRVAKILDKMQDEGLR